MIKALTPLLIFLAIIVSIILIVGKIQSPEFEGQLEVEVPDRRNVVWGAVTDVTRIPYIKRDVEQVEILSNNRGLITWRENLKRGGTRTYVTLEKKEPFLYTIELINSTSGITGTWTYVMKTTENGTLITLHERSITKNVWIRGINKFRGRDNNLIVLIKSLRVALFRNLIDTP